MENSSNTKGKTLSSGARTADSPEESSWTFYFENFICDKDGDSSLSSGFESPSLVSDAGSSVVPKKSKDDDQPVVFSSGGSCKHLSFKKRRTKVAIVDGALEDTASSPVHSPKDLCFFSNNATITNASISEQKGGVSGRTDESYSGIIGRDIDHSELKKRGLCLVPVSMVANYLG